MTFLSSEALDTLCPQRAELIRYLLVATGVTIDIIKFTKQKPIGRRRSAYDQF
jgi:hypothetical protein